MSLPVHWVESLAGVRPGDPVEVVGDEAHHAVAVRRLRAGEQVVLTDGRGTTVTGTVSETGKRRLVVSAERVDTVPEPAPSFTVVQALPKGDRGELAVEVLTEIGVTSVVPWAAARSVAVWRGERVDKGLARWRATAREAAKQARRAWFPSVRRARHHRRRGVAGRRGDAGAGAPRGGRPAAGRGGGPRCRHLVLVVGPEGGLTDDEVAAFLAAGGHAVRLGSEVLRTSTAGVVATAALLAQTPRWTTSPDDPGVDGRVALA